MMHNCSWHHLCQKGRWALKKLVMKFAFNMARLAIWARYCSSGLFDFMLYKLDMQDPQKGGCWFKMDIATRFLLHGRGCQTARQSTGHREKWLTNCQYSWTVWRFLLCWGVCQTHYGLWAEDGSLQKIFGCLTRQVVSVISRVYILSFCGLWWSWRQVVMIIVFLSWD